MTLVRWGLVPLVCASVLLLPVRAGLPFGLGEAAACSPIDPNAPEPPSGWRWLRPSLMSLTDRTSVPVGTDGFFVIDAEDTELNAEAATSSLAVEVRDAEGALVPGRSWLLKEKQPGWYLFGWEASSALELGAKLTATLSGEPLAGDAKNVGGDFPLVVVGEPARLPEPSASFPNWVGFFRGHGPNITCKADPDASTCGGPESVEVPGAFDRLAASQTVWHLPDLVSGVAWEAHLEASPSDSDAQLPEQSLDYVGNTPEPEVWLGLVVFPTDAKRHCVNLVTRDLRSDETTSAEICGDTQPASTYETDAEDLRACIEPPSDTAGEAWCRLHGDLAPSSCKAILEQADSSDSSDSPASGTSKGCQLAIGPGAGSHALFTVLVALFALSRRRRAL